jgi:DNA repair protein SbcD/Mre11
MRFLHTADWHIGRAFAVSRVAEQESVLSEIVQVATDSKVDCVLVSGDIFDSRAPSADAEKLVYSVFASLVGRGIAAVIAGGNHDHPKRLGALRQLLDPLRIMIRPEPITPEEGGVIEFHTADETARIAVLPFVNERQLIDTCALMGPEETWYAEYAENVAAMMNLLARPFSTSTINIMMAHLYAFGAVTSGTEWAIHTALPYAISPARFPPGAQYIALGHLHRPQEVVGSPVPCQYAGSPLQLDFGEQGQHKRVVIVDAKAGRPAHIESVALSSGRHLRDLEGRIDELDQWSALYGGERGDYLRVTILIDGPTPGLADRVKERLPNALQIRTRNTSESQPTAPSVRANLQPGELFEAFLKSQHGGPPSAQLMDAFKELYQEAFDAAD